MNGYLENLFLFGTFHAAEQASRLLADANYLFDNGRNSTSLALAVFSREEVGRARILLRARERVSHGETVSLKSLRKQLESHTGKLKAGLHPVNVHVSLMFPGGPPEPGSNEEQRLAYRLEQQRRSQERRAPQETHEQKMRGIYVDLGPSGHHWVRPKDITRDEAAGMLVSAAVEYDALRKDLMNPHDVKLVAMHQHWPDKPELPQAIWPNWDWELPSAADTDQSSSHGQDH